MFTIIAAIEKHRGIGLRGTIPWDLPTDRKFFRILSTERDVPGLRNAVVMGRSTFESIPAKHSPLKGRRNIVLTRNKLWDHPGVDVFHDFEAGIEYASKLCSNVFVIGGEEIYNQAIKHRQCRDMYITHIHNHITCDTFFPKIPSDFKLVQVVLKGKEKGIRFDICCYRREGL